MKKWWIKQIDKLVEYSITIFLYLFSLIVFILCLLLLSQILPYNGLGPGPGEVGQGGLKVLHLWCHSQRIHIPQPKFFFEC